ncbi:MAG: TonB-dependent receptor [Phycisphaera sp.]|nr:TonB-dependent receptor [Phycisphaera sp.]
MQGQGGVIRWYVMVACAVGVTCGVVRAQATDDPPNDGLNLTPSPEALLEVTRGKRDLSVFDLSLEQLMAMKVTSVQGVARDWFTTPAAIYVITHDEVRRSGHRSLAEALRLAPGVHVAQVDGRNWAISTRGINSLFAGKQLVLIDGRTVYTQLFNGVFWDEQDVMMADLDRIEVTRGPGATLWGANAVNGVISVTTRPADETQGWYLSGGGGNLHQGFGAVRYGGQIDDDTFFRVWGKYDNYDNFKRPDGRDWADDWDMYRTGFRVDRYVDINRTLTVSGGYYGSRRLGENVREPVPGAHLQFREAVGDGRTDGVHLQGKLAEENPEDGSGWSVQSYWMWEDRTVFDGVEANRHTFDLDWRHHFHLNDTNELIWGLGYRLHTSDVDDGSFLTLDPGQRTTHLLSAFVQDTITLSPDRLFAMIGTKLEHNSYTGFEVQPSGRVWWTPDEKQTVWAAVSRAVRTPSLASQNVRLVAAYVGAGPGNTAPFVPLELTGDPDLEAETVIALETGYRVRPRNDLTLDATVFYNMYDNQIVSPSAGYGSNTNRGEIDTYGAELSATWQVTAEWRLTGSYSYLNTHDYGNFDPPTNGIGPDHMVQMRSRYDITRDLEFNAAVYYVSRLRGAGVPGNVRLDLGVTWRPTENLELSVFGQNLLDPSHPEFNDPFLQSSAAEVPRAAYVQATVRF